MNGPLALHLCGGCEKAGRCRLGVTSEQLGEDGVASFDLACPPSEEGGPGTAHGGWTAAILEELLGRVVYLNDVQSVAKSLNVEFLKPVPLGMALKGRSWITAREGRMWSLAGDLSLAGTGLMVARATGQSVLVNVKEHYARFEAWKRSQQPD